MAKSDSVILVLTLLLATGALIDIPCQADDFPGKGDRFAWSNALPYYNLANKYLEHGRFEEAKTNFEEAIYRYEYDPDFYINYGVALRKLESYGAAEESFKKALELRSNDWQACSNLANAYLKENRLKDTIACFQKAMKMQPPPPPKEKEAMLKDIADINKILSMQSSAPAQGKRAEISTDGPTPDKQSGDGKHPTKMAAKPFGAKNINVKISRSRAATGANGAATGANGTATAANGTANGAQVRDIGATEPPAAVDNQGLKKSGWDWVQ